MGYRLWVISFLNMIFFYGKKLSKFIECEVPKVI